MKQFTIIEKFIAGLIIIVVLIMVSLLVFGYTGENECEMFRYFSAYDVPVSCLEYYNVKQPNAVIMR